MKILNKKKKAFSLIEIMVGVIVIAVIAAVFIPTISKKMKAAAIIAGGKSNLSVVCCGNDDCKLCNKISDNQCECIDCRKTCEINEFVDEVRCGCFACNDIENGGIDHCYKCEKNWFTGKVGCKECMPGYTKNNITGQCSRTMSVAQVGTIAWSARNAGESDGPAFDWGDGTNGTVVRCEAGQPCSGGGTTPTCWVGTTSTNCDNSDGYSGCNRPVCNWYAANLICANEGMSLPTDTQFNALRGGSASTAAYNQPSVKFCDYYSGSGSYSRCNYSTNCTGAGDDANCRPGRVWSVQTNSSVGSNYVLENGSLGGPVLHNKQYALSIRCTRDCSLIEHCTACGASGCTECESGYYPNNGECLPCGAHCASCTSSSCTECESGYYLNNGACLPCGEHCARCNSTQCLECDGGGYQVEGFNCVRPPVTTTSINGYMWTMANAGDIEYGGLEIPDGVTICSAGSGSCTISNNVANTNLTPVCWQGTTASSSTTYDEYPGANRTVCNWTAANLICNYYGMTLPTQLQMESLRSSGTTFNPNYAALNLCGTASGSYYAQCASGSGSCTSACTGNIGCNCAWLYGGHSSNSCRPSVYWTQTPTNVVDGRVTYAAYILNNSGLEIDKFLAWNGNQCKNATNGSIVTGAFSVRCVKACTDFDSRCLSCDADHCTGCMAGYQVSNSGGCEEIPEIYTTTINGVTWTTRNAGDAGGPHIPYGVTICHTGIDCTISNNEANTSLTPVCWIGSTADSSTTYDGYSGANRTVCNWTAANLICQSAGMTLPTQLQMESLRSSGTTFNPNYAALNLCGTASGSYYAQCASGSGSCTSACTGNIGCNCAWLYGGHSSNSCRPSVYWTQTPTNVVDGRVTYAAYILNNSGLEIDKFLAWNGNQCKNATNGSIVTGAFSVRCVQAN